MGFYEQLRWRPAVVDGVPRAHRTPGQYWAYVPAPLADQQLALPGDVIEAVAAATAALGAASRALGGLDLDSVTSLTLRSEAVASSVIEGLAVSAKNLALADFTGHGSATALAVARHAGILRRATQDMAQAPTVTHDQVVALQAQLVPALPGLRTEQVWIGGASPLVAEFVPPAPDRVPDLVADLLAYLNDTPDTPVVAAAAVHAQFETIHPFRDGNGRVGRALTHTVLARATGAAAVIPFSRVFAARKQAYVDGLTSWRAHDDVDGRVEWVHVFAEALVEAAGLAEQVAARLEQVRRDYGSALVAARNGTGRRRPRQGSTVLRLLDTVLAHPVDTATSAALRLGVSTIAAREALEELAAVGIYATGKIDKGKTVSYIAGAVLELADELAYGRDAPAGDGLEARLVPTRAERRERSHACGYPLPRAGAWCTELPGHGGRHRRRSAG